MLLMRLESKEKFSFLRLAHYLARIDNTFAKKEEEIISDYCSEMGVENINSFDMDEFNLDEVLNDFKSLQSKKIVLLELMILIHIDNNYKIEEKDVVKKIIKSFNLENENIKEYSNWGRSVSKIHKKALRLIK